jgi:hypothetical protein
MENEKRKAGRPAGTGPRSVPIQDLVALLQGTNENVSVTYRWLEQMGIDPKNYENWKPSRKKKISPVMDSPPAFQQESSTVNSWGWAERQQLSPLSVSEQTEDEVIEFTITA